MYFPRSFTKPDSTFSINPIRRKGKLQFQPLNQMILSWKIRIFLIHFKVSENKKRGFFTLILVDLEGLRTKRIGHPRHDLGCIWDGTAGRVNDMSSSSQVQIEYFPTSLLVDLLWIICFKYYILTVRTPLISKLTSNNFFVPVTFTWYFV